MLNPPTVNEDPLFDDVEEKKKKKDLSTFEQIIDSQLGLLHESAKENIYQDEEGGVEIYD